MFYKLKLFKSVLPIILTGIFYHASAIADENSDNVQTVVNAVAQAVSQVAAPTNDETASSDDNTTDDADDLDDGDVDGTAADIQQTPDDVKAAADAVAKAIDAFNAQDYPKAVKWFSIAAYKYHDARAQENLAKFYANGVGTEQNYPEALKLFRIAARHGTGKIRENAENSVGIMYAKGWGVKQNPKKAMHWMKRSAKHGNHEARDNLTILRKPGSSFKSKVARIHVGSSMSVGKVHSRGHH